jgi:Co/Zn/Cd efflux system component
VNETPDIPAAAPMAAHRRNLELSVGLGLLVFALAGIVGAWEGSSALLAVAAAYLSRAGEQASVAATGNLSHPEHRFLRWVLAGTVAAVTIAACGELLRRLLAGGAPDPGGLVWMALLGIVVSLFRATRIMRRLPGAGGPRVLWSLAGDEILGALAILCAAAVLALNRSRWPDVLAGVLVRTLNRRVILRGVGLGGHAAAR